MQEQVEYMECLKANKNMAEECADMAKTYLVCRMDAYVLSDYLLPFVYVPHGQLLQ